MEEIRNMMKRMEVATARGRAEINNRAISLKPSDGEVERATRERVDLYIDLHKRIAYEIGHMREGMTSEELERIEFIREQLIDLAKDVSVAMVERSAEADR